MIAAPCASCFVPEPVSELRESYVFPPLTVHEDRQSDCGITRWFANGLLIFSLCNQFWWALVAKLWNQYFFHFNIGFHF